MYGDDEADAWLGASPDGLVEPVGPGPGFGLAGSCEGCEHRPGLLEIKCPYNNGAPAAAAPYPLMPYYYMPQVQGQLELLGRDWAHLFCWTKSGTCRVYEVRRGGGGRGAGTTGVPMRGRFSHFSGARPSSALSGRAALPWLLPTPPQVRRDAAYWSLMYEGLSSFWWQHVVPARHARAAGGPGAEAAFRPLEEHALTEALRYESRRLAAAAPTVEVCDRLAATLIVPPWPSPSARRLGEQQQQQQGAAPAQNGEMVARPPPAPSVTPQLPFSFRNRARSSFLVPRPPSSPPMLGPAQDAPPPRSGSDPPPPSL